MRDSSVSWDLGEKLKPNVTSLNVPIHRFFCAIQQQTSIKILHFVDRASRYKFLLITNLTHCFRVFIYFISLHVSSITVLIIRRSNCINTSSGMISLCK